MSFQGDVAGIGLGELLQGLARGGRDGVLTLYGNETSAALGLKKSRLFIVASPDETAEQWRERAQQAWAKDLDPSLEGQRREKIARAARLETLYQMLEAENLHFRFEPGVLPGKVGGREGEVNLQGTTGGPSDEEMERAWGRAVTVEYLLLEHARISDEARCGPAATLRGYDIPRALDGFEQAPAARDFLDECDGNSTLQEIADRLGWTLTQCRHTAGEFLGAGAIRIAQPRELLASAQREIELTRAARAAARIDGWIQASRPGPPAVEDANLLIGEWERNRLVHVLRELPARSARTLLRKLDRVDSDARASRDRWSSLQELHRGDPIITLRTAISRFSAVREPDARAFQELLQVARTFQQREQPARAGVLLRLASSHMPARLQTRIELGKRMLENDLVQEGSTWLLETARELLAEGDPDKALVPLRAILRFLPDNNHANGLLIQARAMMARRKRRRWQTACLGAVALILATVGLVRLHSARQVDKTLAKIEAQLDRPAMALEMLDRSFPDDPSERIGQLRNRIYLLHQEEQRQKYLDWVDEYDAAMQVVLQGDPIEGLELVLELSEAPETDASTGEAKERTDLYGALMKRFVQQSEQLDLPVDAAESELAAEQKLVLVIENAVARMTPEYTSLGDINFKRSCENLHRQIVERAERRRVARAEELERMRQKDQSNLLQTARTHREAGNLSLAIEAWTMLFERDPDLRDLRAFRTEYDQLVAERTAIDRATALAESGRHAEARAVLETEPTTLRTKLPWRIRSRPGNARVTLADGTVKTTPAVIRSAFGEGIEMVFSSDGCVPRTVRVTDPGDLVVNLYRAPERIWKDARVVEASPVPVGDDHILCDRGGRVVRLRADGQLDWETRLGSLGGIKRTPLFLPGRTGHLLILSEEGDAWLLNVADGTTGDKFSVGSPPVSGPEVTRGGITARFGDGRVARWGSSIEPEFFPAEGLLAAPEGTDDGIDRGPTTIRLTRTATLERKLVSPWTSWSVEVLGEEFLVRTDDGRGFSARRQGEWQFVLWEQPKALVPHGRLWVSDEAGVRSFLPVDHILTEVAQDVDATSSDPLGTGLDRTEPPAPVGPPGRRVQGGAGGKTGNR